MEKITFTYSRQSGRILVTVQNGIWQLTAAFDPAYWANFNNQNKVRADMPKLLRERGADTSVKTSFEWLLIWAQNLGANALHIKALFKNHPRMLPKIEDVTFKETSNGHLLVAVWSGITGTADMNSKRRNEGHEKAAYHALLYNLGRQSMHRDDAIPYFVNRHPYGTAGQEYTNRRYKMRHPEFTAHRWAPSPHSSPFVKMVGPHPAPPCPQCGHEISNHGYVEQTKMPVCPGDFVCCAPDGTVFAIPGDAMKHLAVEEGEYRADGWYWVTIKEGQEPRPLWYNGSHRQFWTRHETAGAPIPLGRHGENEVFAVGNKIESH